MTDHTRLENLVLTLGDRLRKRSALMATAESCTGGLMAHTLTNVSGSSDWFAGAVVAYANQVKENVLGVPAAVLEKHGAVSELTVAAMADGAARLMEVDYAVAASGIAGPTGGTPDKPVGTVWLAWRTPDATRAEVFRFAGDRASVKLQTVETGITTLMDILGS